MRKCALIALLLLLSAVLLSTVLSSTVLPAKAATKTWTVDDDGQADFHTIQEAINAASSGDTIFAYDGTYQENVVLNKTLSLIGESKETTFLKANGASDVIQMVKDNTSISGFTIRGAGANPNGIGYFGIRLTSNNNSITDNIITENGGHGIYLVNSNRNIIAQNLVYLNHWCGIVLKGSDYNIISNNNVVQNQLRNNGIGIHLQDGSDFNTVEGNIITKNDGGIGLYQSDSSVGCNYNIIRNNSIFENYHDGIFLYHNVQHNFIASNTLTKNGGGIHLLDTSYNTIVGNTISLHIYAGVGFEHAPFNLFFHNNLIDNTPQVYYRSNDTSWDNGYLSGGNYWSDYNGVDANNDGIGDSPYVIDANNVDRYPLMAQFTADPTLAPTPEPTPILAPTPTPSTSPSPNSSTSPSPTATPSVEPSHEPNLLEEAQNSELSPTTLAIASTGAVSVVGVGLVVYFKKRKH
jgi:nitrous oxidase accessory protein